jgi:hypothetical protein
MRAWRRVSKSDRQGREYWYWERAQMPKISPTFLQSVVYLYPDADSAERGERAGGTGFLVGVGPDKDEDVGREWVRDERALNSAQASGAWALYVVTAAHVVRKGNPVVRMATWKGETRVLDLPLDAWYMHPDGDDVAVCPIGLADGHNQIAFLPVSFVLSEEARDFQKFGPGDDVFFVGRFMGHDGKQRNTPTARFGNIAMSKPEPILNEESGVMQESLLVELRSLPGYSGSPVFAYYPAPMVRLDKPDEEGGKPMRGFEFQGINSVWLLGVDWCHLYSEEPVRQPDGTRVSERSFVKQNSGMAGVVPAWKLLELLHGEELTDIRNEEFEERKKLPTAEPDGGPVDQADQKD